MIKQLQKNVKGSEISLDEEYFDWTSIVEIIAEKERQFGRRRNDDDAATDDDDDDDDDVSKIDKKFCRLQELCRKLLDIFSGRNFDQSDRTKTSSKPTLALDAIG